jgi:prepilin-type N-terminal cleavage/methylation domain-containing protein
MRRSAYGVTLIELLIGMAIVAILAAAAIPTYLGFVRRARETTVIAYLRDVHKGQLEWQLETGMPGFTGDFDELEETGLIPHAVNFVRTRVRAPRAGLTRETSSRLLQSYRLDLRAEATPATNTFTYRVLAYPADRERSGRWFYLDQSGVIRAQVGSAGVGSPPI